MLLKLVLVNAPRASIFTDFIKFTLRSAPKEKFQNADGAWLCERQEEGWSIATAKQLLAYGYQHVPVDKRTLRIAQCTWLI